MSGDSYKVKAKNVAGFGERAKGLMYVGGPQPPSDGSSSSSSYSYPAPSSSSSSTAPPLSSGPSASYELDTENLAGGGKEAVGVMYVAHTEQTLPPQEQGASSAEELTSSKMRDFT